MVTTISPEEIKKKFQPNEFGSRIVIIDVREPMEYAHEHIAQSVNIPLGQLPHADLSAYKDKIAIFHCRSGNRTTVNAHVIEQTPFAEKYCVAGGLEAWRASGLPTECVARAPIDIMRQVQLSVGLMVLAGLALGTFLNAWFLVVPLIAGLGLTVAGTTGFCALAHVLACAPWNKCTDNNLKSSCCH